MTDLSLSGIRHVVFDLGGVLLDIDFERLGKAFTDLGVEDFSANFSRFSQHALFDDYEAGRINSTIFFKNLVKFIKKELKEEDVRDAWNALLGEMPSPRIELIKKLRKNYRVSLLSNTNELHQTAIKHYMHITYGITDLSDLFDRVYLSFRLGLRKPDPSIFLHVVKDSDIPTSETLFIDDTPGHILSASDLGFHTFLADPRRCIAEVFEKIL